MKSPKKTGIDSQEKSPLSAKTKTVNRAETYRIQMKKEFYRQYLLKLWKQRNAASI